MTVTKEELAAFHEFAEKKLSNGGAASIEELASAWRQARELAQLVDDIAESEADIAAGRVHSAEDVFADVRRKCGLSE